MPATIYLVTGGCRSGKSSYAQKLCESLSDAPIYLATSRNWDNDFQQRIQRHRADRGEAWKTIEEPLYPSQALAVGREEPLYPSKALNRLAVGRGAMGNMVGKVVLVDCLTMWFTNFLVEQGALNMPTNDNEDASSNLDNSKLASEQALEAVKEEFTKLTEPWDVTFVFVTNEVGSGTHSDNSMTRHFVDAQGWLNQFVASKAERVIYMVCGQATTIKEASNNDPRDPLPKPTRAQVDQAAMLDKCLSARSLPMDSKGYFMISVDYSNKQDGPTILVEFYSCILNDKGEVCDLEGKKIPCHDSKNRAQAMQTWHGRTAKELTVAIFEKWEHANIVSVGHAAYVGREVQRAEQCMYSGTFYQQD